MEHPGGFYKRRVTSDCILDRSLLTVENGYLEVAGYWLEVIVAIKESWWNLGYGMVEVLEKCIWIEEVFSWRSLQI